MNSIDYTKLEVLVGSTWTNITANTKAVTINRVDGNVGLMGAEILDASLDPLSNNTLRAGRFVRVMAKNGTGWTAAFTGSIDNVEVDKDPSPDVPVNKRTRITISASDAGSTLASRTETRGVGTVNDLRWLLNGAGVAFNVNGQTTPLSTGTKVAGNDNASLWSQILVTRDTVRGYAWVDATNTLRVYDAANIDTSIKANLTPSVYASCNEDFRLDQVINSVSVEWLRYNIGTETSTSVPYGPYEDAQSIADWGRQSETFTIQGATEVEADITAFANDVLSRNKDAAYRPQSAVVPVRVESDLATIRNIDLNSRVNVTSPNTGTVTTLRVIGISHSIEATSWSVEYIFAPVAAVTIPQVAARTAVAYVPDGYIGEEQLTAEVNTDIATGVAGFSAAQSAAQKAQQALDSAAAANNDADAAQAAADAAQADAQEALDDAATAFNAANAAQGVITSWTTPGATTINGGKLETNSVKTDALDALAITAKHTITGAVFQTTATANRGIKVNSTGLIAYNSSGTATLFADASTGAITMLGSLTSGSTVTGATVTGSLIQTTSSTTGGGLPLGIKLNTSGFTAYDSAGSPTFTITASTGAVAMKGDLMSGSTITGASIKGATFQTVNDVNNRGFKLDQYSLFAYDGSGNQKISMTATTGTINSGGPILGNTVFAATTSGAADKLFVGSGSTTENSLFATTGLLVQTGNIATSNGVFAQSTNTNVLASRSGGNITVSNSLDLGGTYNINAVNAVNNSGGSIGLNVANGKGKVSGGANIGVRFGQDPTTAGSAAALTLNTTWVAATTDNMNAGTPTSANTVDFWAKTVRGFGAYVNASDSREKNSIEAVETEEALTIIKGLQVRSYRMNNVESDRTQYGVIAQEAKEVMPSAVTLMGNRWGVSYQDIWAMNLKATQNLLERVEALEAENISLRAALP